MDQERERERDTKETVSDLRHWFLPKISARAETESRSPQLSPGVPEDGEG